MENFIYEVKTLVLGFVALFVFFTAMMVFVSLFYGAGYYIGIEHLDKTQEAAHRVGFVFGFFSWPFFFSIIARLFKL